MNVSLSLENAERTEGRMLAEVLAYCARQIADPEEPPILSIRITAQARTPETAPKWAHPGWAIYDVTFYYAGARRRTVKAISTAADAATEFH